MTGTSNATNAVVVYESMFGSTRRIAEAIADGLGETLAVTLLRVKDAPDSFPDVDLLVVGAPTHIHGLSRPSTRAQAAEWAKDPERKLALEPEAEGIGVRDWLKTVTPPARFAAFDTRIDVPELFGGSAATVVDRRLRKRHSHRFAEKQSFIIDKTSALEAGEVERARSWGQKLARDLGVAANR